MNSRSVVLLGIFLTLVASSISAYTSFFGFASSPDMNAIFSIFLILLGLIITDRISTIMFFDDKIARLIQEITPSDNIKIFSGTDEAIDYFISIDNAIRPMSIVRNTIFKCDRQENTQDQFYSYGMREKWYQKKKKLIDNNVQWNDLGIEIHDKIVEDFTVWTKKRK